MDHVREFLDGLDEALNPTPGANLNTKHYDAFLRQAEALWAQHREAALESVDSERQELVSLGMQVARSIRSQLPAIRRTLTRTASQVLRHLADPSTPLPTVDSGMRLGGGVPVRHSPCSEDELEWIQRQGQEHLVRRARGDIYRWRRTIRTALRKFENGPLDQPLWVAVGDRGQSDTPWLRQNVLDTGLWNTDSSPWRTDAIRAYDPIDASTRGIPSASVAPPHFVYADIMDDCWRAALSDLPLREIGQLHQRQSSSPWVACQILEILLGPQWFSFVGGAHAADARVGEWAQQVVGPFHVWHDANRSPDDAAPIPWLIGPTERSTESTGRNSRAFHLWRGQRTSIKNPAAEPYALMVAYSLSSLAEITKPSPAKDANYSSATEPLDPPVGGGVQLREVALGWEVRLNNFTAQVKGSVGTRYLAELARRPGRPIPCIELRKIEAADIAGVMSPDEHDDSAPTVAANAGDPVCDRETIDACRSRLDELRAQQEHAADEGDLERQETIEEEIREIETYRSGATYRGKRRSTNPDLEKVRKNVSQALNRAITAIEAASPEIGAHLRASVQLGKQCCYTPTGTGT